MIVLLNFTNQVSLLTLLVLLSKRFVTFFFFFFGVIFRWLGLFDTFLFTFQATIFLLRKGKEKWFLGYVMVQ